MKLPMNFPMTVWLLLASIFIALNQSAAQQRLITYNNHAYVLVLEQNIAGARAHAMTVGGYLTSINDAAENEIIRELFLPPIFEVLIGLSDEVTEGTFLWDSAEPFAFMNWAPGHPIGSANGDTVAMRGDGTWTETGDFSRPGIIEVPMTSTPQILNSFSAPGRTYHEISISSIAEARLHAATFPLGHLVAINDAAEQSLLVQAFGTASEAYIGLNSEFDDVSWESGDPLNYTNFVPNDGFSEPYYVMDQNGFWERRAGHGAGVTRAIVEVPDQIEVTSTRSYSENFEAGAGGWTTTGALWENAAPAGTSLNGAVSGSRAWVTNAAGSYPDDADESLVSPSFDFSSLTTDPFVSFQINYDLAPTSDVVLLEVSIDGAPFTTLNSYQGSTAGSYGVEAASLVGTAGQNNVILRFRIMSDGAMTGEGAAVDDIRVERTVPIAAQSTIRASVGPNGEEANRSSFDSDLSFDGDLVVFETGASNFSPLPLEDQAIFMRDIAAGTTALVSVSTIGVLGDGRRPRMTSDGRFVVFESFSSSLVPNAPNGLNIYRRDLQSQTTVLVSDLAFGLPSDAFFRRPDISDDGRFVVFTQSFGSDGGGENVYLVDLAMSTATLVSATSTGIPGNSSSRAPRISGNGAFVTFESFASDLVPNDTNNRRDIFRYERATGTLVRVSLDAAGAEVNASSADPCISSQGRYVAYQQAGESFGLDGGSSNIFLRDVQLGTTTLVNTRGAAGSLTDSRCPDISADGRFVAFESRGQGLYPFGEGGGFDETNILVWDRVTRALHRVSNTPNETAPNRQSRRPAISPDGSRISFESRANDIVRGDSFDFTDVFVTTRAAFIYPGTDDDLQLFVAKNTEVPTFLANVTPVQSGDLVSRPDDLVCRDVLWPSLRHPRHAL